jgi:hypothetical protein
LVHRIGRSDEDAVMGTHGHYCLKRAAECVRLAEAERDPELKAYLTELAAAWALAAEEASNDALEDA